MRTLSIALTLAVVASPGLALAGNYTGKVCNGACSSTTWVANANVRLSNGVTELTAKTDATGSFSFTVAAGTWCAQAWTGAIATSNLKAGVSVLSAGSHCRAVAATGDTWGSISLAPAGRYLGIISNATTSAPIGGAKVQIKDGAGTLWLLTVSSASSGNFTVYLPPGSYTATASKTGFVSNTSTKSVTANADIWGSIALTPVAAADTTPPALSITKPAAGAVSSSTVEVGGAVTDPSTPVTVTVAVGTGTPTTASVSGGEYAATVTVPANPTSATTIKVTATDKPGNTSTKSVSVTYKTGVSGTVHEEGAPGTRLEGATLTLRSGTTVKGTVSSGADGSYRFDVAPGAYTLEASKSGYMNETVSLTVIQTARATQDIAMPVSVSPAAIAITQPEAGATLSASPATVTGTYSGFVPDAVQVNGVAATLTAVDPTSGTFSASVPLEPGLNAITAVGQKAGAEDVTDGVDVTYQSPGAPQVKITSPAQGATVTTSSITVTGTYSGFEPELIFVNETEATFSNGTFTASIDLYPDENFIVVTAQRAGIEEPVVDSVDVTYEAPTEEQPDAGSGDPGDDGDDGSSGGGPRAVEIPDGACGCSAGMEPTVLFGALLLPLALLRRRSRAARARG